MFDLQRITTQSLDLVSRVVDALVTNSGADDASIMVIGAHCRDLLHASFGRADLLRATSDVDIGIAVDGDARYRQIVSSFPRSGTTEIRHTIAGVSVDVVPFGDIEDPAGTTVLSSRRDSLDVFGFREVFGCSQEVLLPSGNRVRIPTPAGYTALKLKLGVTDPATANTKTPAISRLPVAGIRRTAKSMHRCTHSVPISF
ncbi:hypothetical protein ATM97_26175 [Nocardia sp. MH4]|uniref:hypothetical protein n=1 Tax=Nocardia sp. MH4 TaxID=1768677 RepID=UPI001C4FDEE3|nr:hypothetical protein [Nocardia sp. MH4]MBW0273569.1 hypothetical protein [Nocardia sp. MH4]